MDELEIDEWNLCDKYGQRKNEGEVIQNSSETNILSLELLFFLNAISQIQLIVQNVFGTVFFGIKGCIQIRSTKKKISFCKQNSVKEEKKNGPLLSILINIDIELQVGKQVLTQEFICLYPCFLNYSIDWLLVFSLEQKSRFFDLSYRIMHHLRFIVMILGNNFQTLIKPFSNCGERVMISMKCFKNEVNRFLLLCFALHFTNLNR